MLICGGGIGGLALGVACHIAGVPAVVLERAPELRAEVGNGIGLWGPALMALRTLGLEDRLHEEGRFMQCAGYRDAVHGPAEWLVLPSSFEEEDASPSLRLRSCLCIRRGSLQTALRDALPVHMLRLDSTIERVDLSAPAGPTVVLESGEELVGSVVVGADGVWSRVRDAVTNDATAKPFSSGYDYWRAICKFPLHELPPSHRNAFEAWGNDSRFGMVPLAGDDVFWFAVLDHRSELRAPAADNADATKQFLVSQFGSQYHPFVRELMNATPAAVIDKTPIFDMPRLPSFVRRHQDTGHAAVLLGDAAHAMAPNLAQGACLAIEDALELGHQLHRALVKGSVGLPDALHQYNARRTARAHVVQTLVPMVHQVGRVSGRVRAARNAVFSASPVAVSTPVFDTTHRLALGWSYTSPDLGQGLYPRVLGHSAFSALEQRCPLLGRYHRGSHTRRATGGVWITAGTGWAQRLLGRLMGVPLGSVGPWAEVSVDVTPGEDGSEEWSRVFSGTRQVPFCTRQWIEGERMMEGFGPLVFGFDLPVVGSADDCGGGDGFGFDIVLRSFEARVLGTRLRVPIPKILWPSVRGTTRVGDASRPGWDLSVEVRAPTWCATLPGFNRDGDGDGHGDDQAPLLWRYDGQITNVTSPSSGKAAE